MTDQSKSSESSTPRDVLRFSPLTPTERVRANILRETQEIIDHAEQIAPSVSDQRLDEWVMEIFAKWLEIQKAQAIFSKQVLRASTEMYKLVTHISAVTGYRARNEGTK